MISIFFLTMVRFFDILCIYSSGGGDKMNERLKAIRKKLSLSQEAFGKKLGVTGTAISRIEIGNRAITEQMILAICREFNVREEWLRNGTGEMFLDFTEDDFSKAASTLSNDIFVRSLIIEYWKLDEDSKKLFQDFIHKLSNNIKKQAEKQSKLKTDIDAEVQKYREELELEARQAGKSSAYENTGEINKKQA
jgi:transcriptional regulator with XRE-family HTH domain